VFSNGTLVKRGNCIVKAKVHRNTARKVIMMVTREVFKCAGLNYAITLDCFLERVIIRQTLWRPGRYEVSFDQIRALVIERRSIVPFAALTILSAITTMLIGYGPLPSLIHLTPENMSRSTMIGAAACILFALPSVSRLLFVNVAVSWERPPHSLLVRLVPSHSGKRLASMFMEMSNAK